MDNHDAAPVGGLEDKECWISTEQFLKMHLRPLLKAKRKTFVISLVMVTVAVIVLIWSSVMIVGTMREFGGCEEDEWSRATCEQITCSPQRSMVIVKTRRCSGNRFESITRNCTFPTECSPTWSAKEDNCSLTKGGKEVRVMLMKPNKVNNDAIVAFAGLNC